MDSQAQSEITMEEVCEQSRAKLLEIGSLLFTVNKWHSMFQKEQRFQDEHSETHANLMLAYRHIEDARMRLGKVFQALDGGKSVYPR